MKTRSFSEGLEAWNLWTSAHAQLQREHRHEASDDR